MIGEVLVAISVEVVHANGVLQRIADGVARPGAAQIAWILIPEHTGYEVGPSIPVYIQVEHEAGPAGPDVVDQMTLPLIER